MTPLSLREALRRRARAVHGDTGDRGFMLIYVLGITSIITILVASTLVAASSTIVPSVRAAYSQAADAAAQGGLQAFIAYLDKNCGGTNSSVATCTLPTNYSGITDVPRAAAASSPADYTATYSWLAQKEPSNRYFRVRAVGTATLNGITSTKTVIGDVVGGASMNLLDYGVITGFESQSSSTVLADWPARTIALNCTAVGAADVPLQKDQCSTNSGYENVINWSGSSPGTAAGKVAICNATFDAKGGRSNNLPPKAPNPYVDWTESGLNGNNYDDFEPCQTSWGTMTKLLAPANPDNGPGGYYSNDAILVSNSYPGGTGPLFDQPVQSAWQYTSADAGLCSTVPGQNYRSFNLQCAGYPVEVGGSPSPNSTYPSVPGGIQGPQLPTAAPTIPAAACIYAGPTRIRLSGTSAIVTSPQTNPTWIAANAASRPTQCYTGATANGMAEQTISLTSPVRITVLVANNDGSVPPTTPAQAHGSSGWPTTNQIRGTAATTANSVFYLTSGASGSTTSTAYTVTAADKGYTPAANDVPSTVNDLDWDPQWTSDTTVGCSLPPVTSDLRFADCYLPPPAAYADTYSWIKAGVKSAVAANPQNYTSASTLKSLVNSYVSQGNSSDAANSAPTYVDYRSRRWNVSVSQGSAGSCTQSTGVAGTTTTSSIAPPSTDALYANTNGTIQSVPSTDTSCYTATVSLQVGTCNVALVLGVCVNVGDYVWGNGTALLGGGLSIPQFTVTFTVKRTTTTTTTTAATSTFPDMRDVTQYQIGTSGTFGASGPGDLYLQGTSDLTLGIVAANDVILTGTTTTDDPNSEALQIVGRNNVRIYHPVKCADTNLTNIAKTTPGFCPNDITGLYSGVLPTANRPDQQYVNMRGDLASLTIHGAVFALGNSDSSITCPQPPNGGGVCGGEFSVDNFARGSALGQLTEIGTLAMAHHAPVGQEWRIPDTTGQTSRPYSGYQLAQQYQNLKAIFANVVDVSGLLQLTSVTSSLWHIVSVSAGGS